MSEQTGPVVVVGVDGTTGSVGALHFAVAEARRREGRVQLVHVEPSYGPAPYLPFAVDEANAVSYAILEEARAVVASVDAGVPVETVKLMGSRVRTLVHHSVDAAMVVVGEPRRRLERLVTGSTTAGVAAHASVPVVAVPADWRAGAGVGPVVAGLKGVGHADELLAVAFGEAAHRGVPLRVVLAWMLPDAYVERMQGHTPDEQWQQRNTELAESVLGRWREDFPGVEVSVEVVHDEPGHALVRASQDASLLVLLRRVPSRVLGSHLGATGRAVLRAAVCPVEVVPATRTRPEPRSHPEVA